MTKFVQIGIYIVFPNESCQFQCLGNQSIKTHFDSGKFYLCPFRGSKNYWLFVENKQVAVLGLNLVKGMQQDTMWTLLKWVPAAQPILNLCHRNYLPEFNAKHCIETNANITELRRFKVTFFTRFEKSNQEKIELRDNEGSAEVRSTGMKLPYKAIQINSIL